MGYHGTIWPEAPKHLQLGCNDVHVWCATLDQSVAALQILSRTLTLDERDRAGKFYFRRDHDRFIVARGLLRNILSCYLQMKPHDVEFYYSPHGKPALIEAQNEEMLHFNLSHSNGLALYAVACQREVGIDIEYVREEIDTEGIARQFFSPQEVGLLNALPASMRKVGFFRCWTRKEAYIKGKGEGFSLPLDQFSVSLAPGESGTILDVTKNPEETLRWSLRELSPAPSYMAAVAAEGFDWRLSCWQWTDRTDYP